MRKPQVPLTAVTSLRACTATAAASSASTASDFAMKQKVKRFYGILERQFRRYFASGLASPANTGEELLTHHGGARLRTTSFTGSASPAAGPPPASWCFMGT